jgi:hypothetical protein
MRIADFGLRIGREKAQEAQNPDSESGLSGDLSVARGERKDISTQSRKVGKNSLRLCAFALNNTAVLRASARENRRENG